MYNKNLLFAGLIAACVASVNQLSCSQDVGNGIAHLAEQISALRGDTRKNNLLAEQNVEQIHQTKGMINDLAKEVAKIQKQLRPSLLKRATKAAAIFTLGAGAVKAYEHQAAIEAFVRKNAIKFAETQTQATQVQPTEKNVQSPTDKVVENHNDTK